MKKYAIIQKLDNVNNNYKKIKGTSTAIWYGVKIINGDDVIEESAY